MHSQHINLQQQSLTTPKQMFCATASTSIDSTLAVTDRQQRRQPPTGLARTGCPMFEACSQRHKAPSPTRSGAAAVRPFQSGQPFHSFENAKYSMKKMLPASSSAAGGSALTSMPCRLSTATGCAAPSRTSRLAHATCSRWGPARSAARTASAPLAAASAACRPGRPPAPAAHAGSAARLRPRAGGRCRIPPGHSSSSCGG